MKHPWAKKMLVAVGFFLGIFAMFLAVAYGILIHTSFGAAWVVHRLVQAYDDSVPANISTEAVHGTISSGITISNIYITSSTGSPLVRIESLTLQISPTALMHNQVHIGRLQLENGAIFIERQKGELTLSQLAASTAKSVEPKSPNIIAPLPFSLQIDKATIRRMQFKQLSGKSETLLADITAFSLAGRWKEFLELQIRQLEATYFHAKEPIRISLKKQDNIRLITKHPETDIQIQSIWGVLKLNTRWHLEKDIAADINTVLNIPSFHRFMPELDGHLHMKGNWQLSLSANASPHLSGALNCTDCTIEPFGQVNLGLKTKIQNDSVRAQITGQISSVNIEADYSGKPDGQGTLNGIVQGKITSDILSLAHLEGQVADFQLEAQCNITPNTSECTTMLTSSGINVDPIKSASLQAEATIRRTDALSVSVHTLKTTISGIRAEAQLPILLKVENDCIRLTEPTRISVNGTPVTIQSLYKQNDSIEAQAELTKLSLQPFSKLAGMPLSGILDASVNISGSPTKPHISTKINGTELVIKKASLGEMQISATYNGSIVDAQIDGAHSDVRWIQAQANVPLQLDLNQGTVKRPKHKPSHIQWDTLHVTDQMVASLAAIPETLQFDVHSSGSVELRGNKPDIRATLNGRITHPFTKEIEFTSNIVADEKSTQVSLSTIDAYGTPVKLNATADIPFSRLKSASLPLGKMSFRTTLGESRIEGDIQVHSQNEVVINLELSNVRTGLIEPYVKNLDIDATINGSLSVIADPQRYRLAPSPDESWEIHWNISHITPQRITAFYPLPSDFQFDINTMGTLRSDHGALSTNGQLNGWAGPSSLLPFPFKIGFQLDETSQNVSAEWMMPNAVPMMMTATSAFPIWNLLRGDSAESAFQSQLSWGNAQVSVTGYYKDKQNMDVNFAFTKLHPELLRPYIDIKDVSAELAGNGRLALTEGQLQATAGLIASEIKGNGWAFKSVNIDGKYNQAQFSLRVKGRHAFGEDIELEANIPVAIDTTARTIRWKKEDFHRLTWRIPKLSLYPYRKLFNLSDVFDITVEASGTAEGNISEYQLTAVTDGFIRVPGRNRVPLHLNIEGRKNALLASAELQFSNSESTRLQITSHPDLSKLFSGKQQITDVEIQGHLRSGNFNLQFLELFPLFGISKPMGTSMVNIDFDGSINNPNIRGSLTIKDGQFSVIGLGNRIHHVEGKFQLHGSSLKMTQLTFMSGKGKARMWGRIGAKNGLLFGWSKINAVNFPISITGLPKFELNARADSNIRFEDGSLSINTVLLRSQFVKPAQVRSSAKLIPANEHVQIQSSADQKSILSKSIDLHFNIQNQEPITVRGKDMDTYWNARFFIDREQGETRLGGKIDAVRGTFNLLQNIFEIETGQLTLAPIPGKGAFLQLSSSSTADSHTIYLTVTGNLLRPQLQLTSSPPLTEEQILSLLVSGSTQENAEKSAGTITTLLALQYPEVHNLLYEKFGISQLKLETTSQGRTTLKAGKRVTKRSTVYTVVNPNPADNENDVELQVETAITDKTSIGTAVGQKSSSLGVYRKIPIPNPPTD